MMKHYTPIVSKYFTEIVPPLEEDANFNIDANFINSLANIGGLISENPYQNFGRIRKKILFISYTDNMHL